MVEARTTPGGHDCTLGLCGHRACVGMTDWVGPPVYGRQSLPGSTQGLGTLRQSTATVEAATVATGPEHLCPAWPTAANGRTGPIYRLSLGALFGVPPLILHSMCEWLRCYYYPHCTDGEVDTSRCPRLSKSKALFYPLPTRLTWLPLLDSRACDPFFRPCS